MYYLGVAQWALNLFDFAKQYAKDHQKTDDSFDSNIKDSGVVNLNLTN